MSTTPDATTIAVIALELDAIRALAARILEGDYDARYKLEGPLERRLFAYAALDGAISRAVANLRGAP